MVATYETGSREEQERLQALSRYEILDSAPEPAFDDVAALAADVCDTPIALVTFLDQEREWSKAAVGLHRMELPRGSAFGPHILAHKDVTVLPDIARDERFSENPLVRGEPHVRFCAGYPLVSADGHGLGAICVLDRVPHELKPRQIESLRVLGHEVTSLLEMRRELRESRRRLDEQELRIQQLQAQLATESQLRKKAEVELSGRERQLKDSQRIAGLGSWEWNFETNRVTWSDELYRTFGLCPHEFAATYEAYLERVHPMDREDADRLIRNAVKTNGSFAHEHQIIRGDGVVRTLYSTGEVILDEVKKPHRMVGCCQDITARKEIEGRLEKTISLLNSTLESTADGILTVDRRGRLMAYNERFVQMWRLPPAVMKSYDDPAVIAKVLEQLENPDQFLQKVHELYDHPEEESFDTLYFKDGRVFERYSIPQRMGVEIVGRVWSFRDVSDRRAATERLRRSEERYRALVLASAQVVWTTDAKGNAVEDNPTWRRFTGQTLNEVMGRGWLAVIHPDDRERTRRAWDMAVSDGRIFHTEYRLRRMDGAWRHMMIRGVPVRETTGEIREWIGFCLDITPRKQAEQTLRAERDFSAAIIDSLPGVFYMLNRAGRMVRWNTHAEEVSEFSSAEIKQMRPMDFRKDQ